jgi:23S rRNA pseudouridine2605 synthase
MQQRIQKILARAGLGSRRECEEIIAAGRVSVNGDVKSELGSKADPDTDDIRCDGEPVKLEKAVYFVLNKPLRVLCTNERTFGQKRVIDLFQGIPQRLYTVGRLDAESTGLILVTNDGELAQKIAHPRYEVEKTYSVTVSGALEGPALEKIQQGVWLAEGRTGRAKVRILKRSRQFTHLEITIHEGKNREVRRIFAKVGHPVTHLVRTRIGNLHLGTLREGQWIALTREQLLQRIGLDVETMEPLRKKSPKAKREELPKPRAEKRGKKETEEEDVEEVAGAAAPLEAEEGAEAVPDEEMDELLDAELGDEEAGEETEPAADRGGWKPQGGAFQGRREFGKPQGARREFGGHVGAGQGRRDSGGGPRGGGGEGHREYGGSRGGGYQGRREGRPQGGGYQGRREFGKPHGGRSRWEDRSERGGRGGYEARGGHRDPRQGWFRERGPEERSAGKHPFDKGGGGDGGGPRRYEGPRREFSPEGGGPPRREFRPQGDGARRDYRSEGGGGRGGPRRESGPRGGSGGPRREFRPEGGGAGGPRREFRPQSGAGRGDRPDYGRGDRGPGRSGHGPGPGDREGSGGPRREFRPHGGGGGRGGPRQDRGGAGYRGGPRRDSGGGGRGSGGHRPR